MALKTVLMYPIVRSKVLSPSGSAGGQVNRGLWSGKVASEPSFQLPLIWSKDQPPAWVKGVYFLGRPACLSWKTPLCWRRESACFSVLCSSLCPCLGSATPNKPFSFTHGVVQFDSFTVSSLTSTTVVVLDTTLCVLIHLALLFLGWA